jgi:hypothetical protein
MCWFKDDNKMYYSDYEIAQIWRDCNSTTPINTWVRARYNPVCQSVVESRMRAFIRDIKGTIWGDADAPDGGIMSADMIADYMGMDADVTTNWLYTAAQFGFTDRQGGAWVI